MSRLTLFLGLVMAVVLAAPCATAAPPPKTEKSVPWSILQVNEEYRIVKKSDANVEKKKLTDQFTQELKDWTAAKKQAIKEKQKFDTPMPVKPKITQLPGTYKSEEEANAQVLKLQEAKSKKK